MKRMAFLVMVITLGSKLLSFGREVAFSYFYGASSITDAYLISQTIPFAVFSFIAAGITTGFIPMYSRILQENGRLEADRFTNNLLNTLLLLTSIVVATVLLFTGPIVKLFASGFVGETLDLAIQFTRISVFVVYFTGLLNIFSGYLRLHNNYLVPGLVGFPFNLFVMAFLLISTKTSIHVLAVGSIVATASQLLLLVPFTRKSGYRYEPVLKVTDEHLKAMAALALPVIIGTSVNQINVLVDRTLASGIAVGGISALNYANSLNLTVQGLFVVSLTTVMYPMISKMVAEDNMVGLKRSVSEAISIINLVLFPATAGAMIFSREIIGLLFGRGAFTAEAIDMTANALFYYSVGMVALGWREVLARAFYALQDTKTPMINATIGVIINIALNIMLSRFLGIGGLALATSIAAIVCALLLFITLRNKIGGFGLREIIKSAVKITFASATMGLTAILSFNVLRQILSKLSALMLAIGIAILV